MAPIARKTIAEKMPQATYFSRTGISEQVTSV
jgi:hypothetical protein